jgi:hypothetical protein
MGRLCKHYVDRLFGTRCNMNVLIEAADIIARSERPPAEKVAIKMLV